MRLGLVAALAAGAVRSTVPGEGNGSGLRRKRMEAAVAHSRSARTDGGRCSSMFAESSLDTLRDTVGTL
jgi:hypothetical protein